MKRVMSFATTGLFVTGLALLPIAAHADQTATGGKSTASTPAASATKPSTSTATTTAQPGTPTVKKDDKNMTATPAGTAPATNGAAVKPPAKGG